MSPEVENFWPELFTSAESRSVKKSGLLIQKVSSHLFGSEIGVSVTRNMNPLIKQGNLSDIEAIYLLYQKVSSSEGGLARNKDEITTDYVSSFVRRSIQNGVIYVSLDERRSVVNGEIHCYCPNIKVFSHVLSELTIAVDPDYQGKGIGRMLFRKLLDTVINEKPEILRVELIARESNVRAIKFYESLGFKIEGRFVKRIKSITGGFEADVPMAWLREL